MPSQVASMNSRCLDELVIKSGVHPCTRQPGADTQGASYFGRDKAKVFGPEQRSVPEDEVQPLLTDSESPDVRR